tara:strand:+ start:1305 stop:2384 length:1080 start_codon:yes stop_codon:yes gene_type:complete
MKEKRFGKNGICKVLKVLIIGNEGYIGPHVVNRLKRNNDNFVAGFDIGYFAHSITSFDFPEKNIDIQHRGDVRNFPKEILNGFDAVIYLAAISNDPMGQEFENVTFDINQHSAISIAEQCKELGVNNFIYASSCSVYGSLDSNPRKESSELNPLTAYAKSKIGAEKELESLSSADFKITCLRFATACGFSSRLRLDLVLNDFVASALVNNKIEILSNGSPWRPLIHVKDMARAFDWALNRKVNSNEFLTVNVGSNQWNYQIKQLAEAVKKSFPTTDIFINEDAPPDKRSYKVDFSLFKSIAIGYEPKVTLIKAVEDIATGLKNIGFSNVKFRESNMMRLNILRSHIDSKRLDKNLSWKQ